MQASDGEKFKSLIDRSGRVYQRDIEPELLEDYWMLLSGFNYHDIEKAFTEHFKSSKYFPTPADIIGNLPNDGSRHPGGNEAWGIALVALDENRSVIYTQQIAEALDSARELFHSGDVIAARMAFKDAYKRNMQSSLKPVWIFSQGYDRAERGKVALKALSIGIIDESLVMELVSDYVPKDPIMLERYRIKNKLFLTQV